MLRPSAIQMSKPNNFLVTFKLTFIVPTVCFLGFFLNFISLIIVIHLEQNVHADIHC